MKVILYIYIYRQGLTVFRRSLRTIVYLRAILTLSVLQSIVCLSGMHWQCNFMIALFQTRFHFLCRICRRGFQFTAHVVRSWHSGCLVYKFICFHVVAEILKIFVALLPASVFDFSDGVVVFHMKSFAC